MTRRPGKGRQRIALKDRLLPVLISLLSVIIVFGGVAYFVAQAPQWPRIQVQFFSLAGNHRSLSGGWPRLPCEPADLDY